MYFESYACVKFDFSQNMDLTKIPIQFSQPRVIWFRYTCKTIHIKHIWNAYLAYNKFLKYGFTRDDRPSPLPPKIRPCRQIVVNTQKTLLRMRAHTFDVQTRWRTCVLFYFLARNTTTVAICRRPAYKHHIIIMSARTYYRCVRKRFRNHIYKILAIRPSAWY
jgi:hypothetical protein